MTQRFRTLPIAVLTAGLASCTTPAPDHAPAADGVDLVLLNGRIVTMDDERPEVSALAADGGRIVALGSDADVRPLAGSATEVIDLGGRFAMPGFIDAHAHFAGLGEALLELDLRGAASWSEIVAMVGEAAADTPAGEWIRGRGWHQEKWNEALVDQVEGFPTHQELSRIAPDHPVALAHASGHAIFVNARAMELAGIDDDTPNPEGGEILRDGEGHATGLLREAAEQLVPDDVLSPARWRRMVELASADCRRKGVTTLEDAGSTFGTIAALRESAAEGLLGVRLWVMIGEDLDRLSTGLVGAFERPRPDEWVAVGGIKYYADGALGSRGAWLLEPYADAPDSTGLPAHPMDEIREVAALAIEHGYQLGVHAIGDRANREVLDVYEETLAAHPEVTDPRWRIEHAQHLDPADVPRFAELGVIAAMQGIHCTSDGPWVPDRLGEARAAAGAYVWQDLLRSGATIANGTDAPVEDIDPIANFYASVSRRLSDGSVFSSDQRLSRTEALRSYTIDAARAAYLESDRGSLEVGKLADVVVLSQDLLTVDEDRIPATEVVYTILDGQIVHRSTEWHP